MHATETAKLSQSNHLITKSHSSFPATKKIPLICKTRVISIKSQPGLYKICFVWYPKFFQKNLSYETRDCLYKKNATKNLIRMVLCTLFVSAQPKLVVGLSYS